MSGVRFGVLAEDATDCDAVAVLVRRIAGVVTSEQIGIDKHATGGCAELRKKARTKMAQMADEGCRAAIVIHDLDLNPDNNELNSELALRRRLEAIEVPPGLDRLICIPVEELEAWFWSDPVVVRKVGRGTGKDHPSPHLIKKPKEQLQKLSAAANGRPRYSTNNNAELAKDLDLALCAQRCPSFRSLQDFVHTVLMTLASGQSAPSGIAVDGNSVYWTNGGDGTVMKIARSGGAPIPLASHQANPSGIAVDATRVYWTNDDDDGAVMAVALSGGTPVVLASDQANPSGIAADAASVYWTNKGDGTVMKAALAGGAPTVLASGQANPSGIAVDATSVYWTNYADGTVMRLPLTGGTPTAIASGQSLPLGLAVDGTHLYWTNQDRNGAVMKMALAGGTPVTIASGQPMPTGIAVDASDVYWTTDTGSGAVMRTALSGGTPTAFAPGQRRPTGIVVDGAYVYWTNLGGGGVMKAAK